MIKEPGRRARGTQTGRPIMVLLDVLGQRWTLRILWELRNGPLNFRALQRACEQVSPTILNSRLRQLRSLGFVELGNEGYAYSAMGDTLQPLLATMHDWAEDWAKALSANMPLD